MNTTKRIVCVLCGVLALCLLFLDSTPVQASSYGQYGYSIRNINGQYEFVSFDENTSMYLSLNSVASTFYTAIREQYTSSDFHWSGQSGSVLYPLDFYLSSGIIQHLKDLDLSNPEFLVNVLVYTTNATWDTGSPVFYFTKNNNDTYSYDSEEHKFTSKDFMALPDIVPEVLSVRTSPLFYGGTQEVTTSKYTSVSSYPLVRSNMYLYYGVASELDSFFESWLDGTWTFDSFLLFPYYSTYNHVVTWYVYRSGCGENTGFYVPIAIQSRLYKINNGYSLQTYYESQLEYFGVYATDEQYLSESPFIYYAEPFSSYINTPFATPTPIAPQPTRPLVLPTFQPFATPTPITGIVVPTYNTDDDTGSVISYALGNVTTEFIKPIYAMVVSVINYMFYNNIWFSFLVVAPSIAFIVFIIGRLRKK